MPMKTVLSVVGVAAMAALATVAPAVAAQAQAQEAPRVEQAAPADGVIWRAEELLGRTIRTPAGDDLAAIDDLVINSDLGVVHVLVDIGGVAGIGDKPVAIALHELTLTPDGALILDTTPQQLAERPHYRFPESPTTGAIRPGREMPQTAAGIGAPGQGPQYMPGVSGSSAQRQERADLPGDTVRDTPLALILRHEGPGSREGNGRGDGDGATGYADREQYLQAAARSLEDFGRHLPDGHGVLAEKYATATHRLESLRSASEETWPTVLRNFRVSVAQLQDTWQQAQGGNGREDGREDGRSGGAD